MKKIAILLAVLMLLGLVACAAKESGTSTEAAPASSEPVSTKTPETKPVDTEPAETEAPETEPVETEASETDPVETKAPDSEITPAALEAAIAAALGEGYGSTVDVPEDEVWSCALGYLDLDQISDYVAKQALIPSLDMDSVVIVRCKDAAYADEAVQRFNESFAQTMSYIRMYPFGVAKVEGARLYQAGDIVMYIIGGASAEADASAEDEQLLADAEYAKIDEAIKSVLGYLPENLAVIPEAGTEGGGFGGVGGFGGFGDYDGGDYDGGDFESEYEDNGDTPVVGG